MKQARQRAGLRVQPGKIRAFAEIAVERGRGFGTAAPSKLEWVDTAVTYRLHSIGG